MQIMALQIGFISILFLSFYMFFNRVPHRKNNSKDSDVVSPTDGYVMDIRRLKDGQYHVMIFLSIFDVHCQWYPINGLVTDVQYKSGTFAPAYMLEKSKFNESSQTSIETKWGLVKVKQIAGQIARRVVNHSEVDQTVQKGDIMGKIILSSRVDVFLPPNVEIYVKKGDTVVGNKTILATFNTTVYMDGVFDLFHIGHVRAIQQMKKYGNRVIIGIVGDDDATEYKRKPIICEQYRREMIEACKYVDSVICPCPLIMDQDFLHKHHIDHVVHAFADDSDYEKQKKMFMDVELIQIKYCEDISTSDIIEKIIHEYE